MSPWSKKIAKSCPPKTVKAQSIKRKSKKRRRQQTSSEEESASHSLKQKRPSSCHSTPSGIEEVNLPVMDNIETVSRASSVVIWEHEYDDDGSMDNGV